MLSFPGTMATLHFCSTDVGFGVGSVGGVGGVGGIGFGVGVGGIGVGGEGVGL